MKIPFYSEVIIKFFIFLNVINFKFEEYIPKTIKYFQFCSSYSYELEKIMKTLKCLLFTKNFLGNKRKK